MDIRHITVWLMLSVLLVVATPFVPVRNHGARIRDVSFGNSDTLEGNTGQTILTAGSNVEGRGVTERSNLQYTSLLPANRQRNVGRNGHRRRNNHRHRSKYSNGRLTGRYGVHMRRSRGHRMGHHQDGIRDIDQDESMGYDHHGMIRPMRHHNRML